MKKLDLLLAVVLAVSALRCASAPAQTQTSANTDTAQQAWNSGPPATIGTITAAEDLEKISVTLGADAPVMYTSYNPEPRILIVDVSNARLADPQQAVSLPSAEIESVRVREIGEYDKPVTRLEITTRVPMSHEIFGEGKGLAISFARPDAVALAEITDRTPPAAAPMAADSAVADLSPAPGSEIAAAVPPAADEPAPAAATLDPATRLDEITASGSGADLAVLLLGDGEFAYKSFRLHSPPRLVVDLDGVRNASGQRAVEVDRAGVSRVRVSQFQTSPKPISRVVFDLSGDTPYSVRPDGSVLRVFFGETSAALGSQSSAAPAPAVAASEPATTTTIEPAPGIEITTHAPLAAPEAVNPPATSASAPMFEAADVDLQDAGSDPPLTRERALPAASFEKKELEAGESKYTGELISLRLKDADIKDVLNTFAEITGLNMAIDPGVRGTVTVNFQDIPWDQALEIILKQNNLGYVLDGNVMRIAPTARLRTEERERRELAEARELSGQTQTVLKPLSYARANELMTVASSVLSKRGKIIIDRRTNTLVITDLKEYMPRVLKLVDELDTPTPQVSIEARIVETSKNFSRNLGISWGTTTDVGPGTGTSTGLEFPSSIAGTVGVALPSAGQRVLSLSMGNVLDTFRLDVALTAAEGRGLAKVLSAPKVTTLNNEAASIQTGIQIPVQTSSNNTTTVQYINATLRLEVTPQVTAEGTVILDIHVAKKEPIAGFLELGGRNVPLSTRDAVSKLMVKDGGTAVIGGIYQLSDNLAESRIPFLADIPILGLLFKNRTKSTSNQELLIFVTPRIIRN